ncbi:hypothetical protein Val02_86390 [Virgisporangium aliadipatigenens]|uniref:Uncharacterized protein n=1 Tax=Virgisporangium aliadipatigenens TaxID=741659 RepID=A0A8J3YWB9_9ACTN|nr:hypothetical protein [Virgisporangium aliadipatigenens]GIJ51753.1 hypothetical protein Val02_86390 [Virgisporangium aliadipatigenens]
MPECQPPTETGHPAEAPARAGWSPPELRRLVIEETAAGAGVMPDGPMMMMPMFS